MKRRFFLPVLIVAFMLCANLFPDDNEDASGEFQAHPTGHYYVEYQVIQVPVSIIKSLSEKAEGKKSLEQLLPEIYESNQVRVISSAAGRILTDETSSFRMVKQEFFPNYYLLPHQDPALKPLKKAAKKSEDLKDADTAQDTSNPDAESSETAENTEPPKTGEETGNKVLVVVGPKDLDEDGNEIVAVEEPEEKPKDDNTVLVVVGPKDRPVEEEADSFDDFDDDDDDDEKELIPEVFNNLEGLFPLFKDDPTSAGNAFTLKAYRDVNTHTFDLRSHVQKNSGSSYMDYGEWGRAPMPVWDVNSFSSIFQSEDGELGLLSSSPAGNTNTTLHVFYMRMLSDGDETLLKPELKQQLNLTVRIVRTTWKGYLLAARTSGRPVLPPEDLFPRIEKTKSYKLVSERSFKVLSGKTATSGDDCAVLSFSKDYVPGSAPGELATPSSTGTIETGTRITVSPIMLDDDATVRLQWHYQRGEHLGQRTYSYRYRPADDDESEPDFQYAMDARNEQPGKSASFTLPMVEQNDIAQTTFIPLDTFILMSKISNPSFQSDTVTMYFVKASKSGGTSGTAETK